jgi:hypothetical protein
MAKMTPEAEARHALNFGVAKSGLSKAAQEIYDRMAEQQARGEAAEGASLVDAEAAGRQVVKDAQQAVADGRKIFLCRVPTDLGAPTGGMSAPSSVIESIERLGWRLDHMSWVPRAGFRAEGVFLFRRSPGAGNAGSPASG